MTIWNGKKNERKSENSGTLVAIPIGIHYDRRVKNMKIKDKYLSFYYETSGGETPEPKIDPKKTALLLVDLQNEFVSRDYG